MCVIIAKNKSDRLPTKAELTNCFKRNPDGAGFMYTYNGKVVIDKGYMTEKSFLNRYEHLLKKFDDFKDKSLVIHCRIGTAGTNTAQNTHPYPVTSSLKRLHKTYTTCNLGIAHNGIISKYNPDPTLKEDVNDTQLFISTYLSSLYQNYHKFYKDASMVDAINYLTSSKFAILTKEDDVITIGDFVNHEGLDFSNTSYNEAPTYSYYDYKDWSWDDWYKSPTYKKTTSKETTTPLLEATSQAEENKDTPAWGNTKQKINYNHLADVPESFYIEYNGKAHRGSEEYYVIDIDTDILYLYNSFINDFEKIGSDYILYNGEYEVVHDISEWL